MQAIQDGVVKFIDLCLDVCFPAIRLVQVEGLFNFVRAQLGDIEADLLGLFCAGLWHVLAPSQVYSCGLMVPDSGADVKLLNCPGQCTCISKTFREEDIVNAVGVQPAWICPCVSGSVMYFRSAG